MTYETVSRIAQQGGAVYFLVIFVIAVAYAFWPRMRDTFEKASRAPFDEEPPQ